MTEVKKSKFMWNVSIVIIAFVILAFGIAAMVQPHRVERYVKPLVIVHIIFTMSWLILFAYQSKLILAGNIGKHRKNLNVGLVLVFLITIQAMYLTYSWGSAARFIGESRDVVVFAILFLWSVRMANKGKMEWHKSLMFIACLNLINPAFTRFGFIVGWSIPVGLAVTNLIWIIVPIIRDKATNGSVHRATIVGILFTFLSNVIMLAIVLSPLMKPITEFMYPEGEPKAIPLPSDFPSTSEVPTIEVSMDSVSYNAPITLPAGYVTVNFTNKTKEMHSAHLIKLDKGYTEKEMINAYMQTQRTNAPRPDWMVHRGGTIAAPGSSAVTLFLEPGNYAWVCVMGDAEPHLAGYEHQAVKVEGKIDRAIKLKEADVTITMTDDKHELNPNIQAGSRALDVINTGSKYHLAAIAKLNEGATKEDVVNFYTTFQGPPPFVGVTATSAIGSGLTARLDLDFEPGNYVLFCMANAEGTFHLLEGAIREFTVNQ